MTAPLSPLVAHALLLLGVAVLGGCTSFDTQWRTAAPGATLWEGRWTSEKHRTADGGASGGRLRCILEPTATNALHARFRANWLTFAGDYAMILTPISGARTEFRGTHELPALFGGTYRYTARIAGEHFTARYDSSYDHGTFRLERVGPAKDSPPGDTRH